MANYAASVLTKVQSMIDSEFNAPELRVKPAPVLTKLLENRDFLVQDVTALKQRDDHPIEVYLKDKRTSGNVTARSHNHTGGISDSTAVTPTFSTYGNEFSVSLKRGDYNVLQAAEILNHEIQNGFDRIYEAIETDMVSFLDTNKTTVSNPVSTLVGGTFNGTNDVFEVASASKSRFWQLMKSIMRQHKYSGNLDVIADPLLFVEGEFTAQQGGSNSSNLGFQFSGLDVSESVELGDADYVNGIAYAFERGSVGILDWIPRQNREGFGDIMSYTGGYSVVTDPRTGLQMALHGYTDRADTSASNGQTQDLVTYMQMSIDLAPLAAPISVADETPIYEFGIPS